MKFVIEWSVSGAILVDANDYEEVCSNLAAGKYDDDLSSDYQQRQCEMEIGDIS